MLGFFFVVMSEVFDDKLVVVDIYERCKNGVSFLCDEKEEFGFCSGKIDNFIEVNDEISKLNGGV